MPLGGENYFQALVSIHDDPASLSISSWENLGSIVALGSQLSTRRIQTMNEKYIPELKSNNAHFDQLPLSTELYWQKSLNQMEGFCFNNKQWSINSDPMN